MIQTLEDMERDSRLALKLITDFQAARREPCEKCGATLYGQGDVYVEHDHGKWSVLCSKCHTRWPVDE